ncbi:MAG: TonB-dependent receptor [Bacteroidota bacterium]|nr:TonB-dependent receptor [Bacteroidota bacterium]
MKKLTVLIFFSLLFSSITQAQQAHIRGFVYDKENGEPIIFTNVILKELMIGKATDINGFYELSKVKPGTYTLMCWSIGYDTAKSTVTLYAGRITTQNLYLKSRKLELDEVEIRGDRQKVKENTNISTNVITQKELKQLPTFGGEPDLVQYLQVLPGVNFSGDQGGQLYMRGGPPVMNKVLMDGMIIYNPFHSIGLFSVFDADIIKNADVSSGGFNAQYGGRISGVIDVTTREGNKKRFAGKIAVNPITAKILLEGPINKFTEGGGSSSYIFSYKTSYLDKSGKLFYNYADPVNGLPYSFNDVYVKFSNISPNGSRVNLFGFRFDDLANFSTNKYKWNSNGFGGNILVIPEGSTVQINANLGYSGYLMKQIESDGLPRESSINSFNASVYFSNFIGNKDDIRYGFDAVGFSTNFNYINGVGRKLEQSDYTTEVHGFVKYKKVYNRFVFEPGIRIIYYSSLSEGSFEPRFGMKYNAGSAVRLKLAAGKYSQNLMSAVSDQDVINLFYGFLSSPDKVNSDSKRQTAEHVVGGIELDMGRFIEMNIECFYKNFSQITNINHAKIYDDNQDNQNIDYHLRADIIKETGNAYGGDARLKYERKSVYLWAVYSLTFVTRNDGLQNYVPHFDRRHNVNIVFTYQMGYKKSWSFNSRWNYGSGYPFTQTQGFYELLNLQGGVSSNIINQNGNLGINYNSAANTGRLPYFHRLDLSVSKKFFIREYQVLTVTASATNVYNRENIFYFDRVNYKRINQLPIMPTLGINYTF